ncbi:uncharacterized protein B0H64DRAFT_330399 [Chaetomium fimeti]|uniref:Uncharacterized protein n=1 Tax=Chaetomium fimeti TaxID=1854472 RepID=A0AAE0H7M4_9PEZI|nr:hypothetical protein B0H64DRAFT_330399 [Chaetomium fimeti]
MKKTPGVPSGAAGSPPTARPAAAAASAAPSTPSVLPGLHPGDARHEISAIRRSSGHSSGNQASLLRLFPSVSLWVLRGPLVVTTFDLEACTSPLAGKGGRAADNRGDSTPDRIVGKNTRGQGGARAGGLGSGCVGQGDNADNEEEDKDDSPAGEPVFPGVRRLLYRATDPLFSSPAGPYRLPAPTPQHQISGAQDETAGLSRGPLPTHPPGSHLPAPQPSAPSAPSAHSAPPRLPKIVIKGSRPAADANNQPTAADTKIPRGEVTVPSGNQEASAAAGDEEQAGPAQRRKKATKIKLINRSGSSLAIPKPDNGDSGAGNEEEEGEEEEAGTKKPRPRKRSATTAGHASGAKQAHAALQHDEPSGVSAAVSNDATKPTTKKPRGKKAAPAPALPPTSALQHQNQNLGPSEPSDAADNTPNQAPKPKRKSRAKKDAPFPASPPNELAGEGRPYGPPFDAVGGLASGAFVQPSHDNDSLRGLAPTGPSHGSSEQSSLDYRLAEPDAYNPPGEPFEHLNQAAPGLELFDAARINPALGAPIPFPPPDPITALFPTLTPGTGPCNPTALTAEPDSSIPQAIHEDIRALAQQATLFSHTTDSVVYAHDALDNCGYDFAREPLRTPIPRAVRGVLAGHRPFAFPRSGANPFMGAEVADGEEAEVGVGVGVGVGVDGMIENGGPEGRPLVDGVVVPPALPATIRGGMVFERADNVLLIPAGWKGAFTPPRENGRGFRRFPRRGAIAARGGGMDIEQGRGEPGAAAVAVDEGFNDRMAFERRAYVEIGGDVEDDLYGNSQAGNITTERQGPGFEDNTPVDFEHPIYPGAAPQPAIGGYNANNGFGFAAPRERLGEFDGNGLGDNAILNQGLGITPAEMDATLSGGTGFPVPDYHPNNLNQQAAALNDDFPILNGQAAVAEGQPASFNGLPAASNYNFFNMSDQGQPNNFNEQSAAVENRYANTWPNFEQKQAER